MPNRDTLTVLRLPGAPAWRAGRQWPAGVPVSLPMDLLDQDQVEALEDDPGYRLTRPQAKPTTKRGAKS